MVDSHIVSHENGILQNMQMLYDIQRFIMAKPSQVASGITSTPPTDSQPVPCNFAAMAEGYQPAGDSHQFTTFNEKKLGPFTEYRKFQRCHGMFCDRQYCNNHSFIFPRNSPPKSARFQRQAGIPRRARHNSCSACPQTYTTDIDHVVFNNEEKSDLHVRFCLEGPQNSRQDERLVNDAATATTSVRPKLISEEIQSSNNARPSFHGLNFLSIGGLQETSTGRMSLQTMPFSPIITPVRTEYTSITDDIDTSCVNHRSPPNTPTMLRWTDPETKRKKGAGRRRKRTLPNDQLKKAEETVHKQMEFMVHKRIRQLSLTETESTGNLAKHALESLVDGSEDENDTQLGHHSDDEATCSAQTTTVSHEGLKPIKSEPFFTKKMRIDNDDETSKLDPVYVNVRSNENLSVDQGVVSRATSDEALSFSVKPDTSTSPLQATPAEAEASVKRSNPVNTDVVVSFTVIDEGRHSPSVAFTSHSNSSC